MPIVLKKHADYDWIDNENKRNRVGDVTLGIWSNDTQILVEGFRGVASL